MTESTRSKLPYVLVISLIINALLVGLIIGGGLGKRGGSDRPPAAQMPTEMLLLSGIESRLPTAERRTLRTVLRKSLTEGAGSHFQMRQARSELNQLLAQDEVSADEIMTVLAAIRGVDTVRREAIHTELANQLSQLSLEERQDLLENLGKRRGGFRDRFERRGPHGPPRGDRPPPR